MQVGRKRHDCPGGNRADAGHRAEPAHLGVDLHRLAEPERELVDFRRQCINVVEVEPGNVPDAVGQIDRLVLHGGPDVRQVRHPLREYQTEFGQMSSQSIDHLRALPDEALVGTIGNGARLMLRTFHSNIMYVRPYRSFGDRGRVRCIILLALHKRLDVDRRDQPDFVSMGFGHSPPEVARRTRFHGNDTTGLLLQQHLQLRARNRAVV